MEQDTIDAVKESVVNEIFTALTCYAPNGVIEDEDDVRQVRVAIEDLLMKKMWLPYEIVRYLRWLEHVNPETEEDVALRNMAAMRKLAEDRISQSS